LEQQACQAESVPERSGARVSEAVRQTSSKRVRSLVEICQVRVTQAGSSVGMDREPPCFSATIVSSDPSDPLDRANNVSLPDEYDQIERDLLPFRALSPQELGRRQDELSGRHPTYTLQVTNGSLHTLLSIEEGGASVSDFKYRVEDQVALIEPIVNYLEDFKAVYWLHDNPATAITYDHRQELLKTLRGRQCK
jgi:hypothetical protein